MAETQKAQMETQLALAETQRAQAETQRAQAETQKSQMETQRAQAETQKAQEQTQKAQAETRKAETKTQKAQTKTQISQANTQRAQAETKKAQAETQKAQAETQKALTETQKALAEIQKALAEIQKAQAESKKDHIANNTDQFKRPFENMMVDTDKHSLSPKASIFRTPKILFRQNEKEYKPNAFSFGPLHLGDKQLEPTQSIKWKYLQGLLYRLAGEDPAADLQEQYRLLIIDIGSVQKEARECYAGPIDQSIEEEFVETMVLDGCFIIELFRKDASEVTADEDDPIFSMSHLQETLKHDLILLENQIPWLVLVRLFNLTASRGGKPLIQLALDYFSNMISSVRPSLKLDEFETVEIKHILDLLRHSLLLPLKKHHDNRSIKKISVWGPLPCATNIDEAGIKFKKVSAESILDVQFKNGVLEIPSLVIQETSETIFRNLISFEQCCPNYQPIVTSYAKLMDNLIDTSKDAEILLEKEILDSWLNPGDDKNFFNKLCNDVYVKNTYYGELYHQVNLYRRHWWPRWRFAYLHYFTTPWAVGSQIFATTILVLTFLQTLLAMRAEGK